MQKLIKNGSRTASITLDGSECEVKFDSTYTVFSVKADSDVTVALESGKSAGDDGVMVCPAGDSIMYPHMQRLDRLYITGSGNVSVFASNEAVNPFKKAAKGGGKNESCMIYNRGKDMNGHTVSVYHTSGSSGKFVYGIYVYYWLGGAVFTDMLDFNGYSRIGFAVRAKRNGSAVPAQTIAGIYYSGDTATNGRDNWITAAPITAPINVAYTADGTTDVGGIFYIDIPKGVNSGYLGFNTVNNDLYIYSIWLE